ncbi:7 transmembrane receptor [Ancylostoma ceylanicum]|uniref:7 transmembrane receptor n=1 Tax=Ancylostoma ceylanicum TaxID=53326 RepID=A0A0D6M3Q3_9BILA|nr:7 transmembrane receptor [Ancylostoma ceylanicum]
MLSRNGTLLYQYLLNVTYEDQFKQSIYFDSNGDPPAWYDILNYVGQRKPDEPYSEVGSFQSNNINGVEELNMTDTQNIVFFDRSSILPETCLPLPHETLSWSSFGSILALILATVGMITTTLTTIIFMRHNSTPVVKSTTRELSYIILSGGNHVDPGGDSVCDRCRWCAAGMAVCRLLLSLPATSSGARLFHIIGLIPHSFSMESLFDLIMYCTLVVWIAFIVLHMGTVNKALTMSFSFSLSASIPLILLFFPKLYIIILHPEKNVRASYTTTKLIRSSTKSSSLAGAGVTRTASVHVPVTTPKGVVQVDNSTQTDTIGGKFARSFSIAGKKKPVALDEDVAQLVEACRRYQDEKLCATAANLLLEEQEDEVGALLADSIENSVRTVLSTVAGGVRPTAAKPPPPQRTSLTPTFIESVAAAKPMPTPAAPVPKPPRSRPRQRKPPTIDEDGFEELLRSRGVQPLQFSQATPL